jgi:hypothetical protein
MADNQGFDDQFNDGLFRTSLNNSRLERPRMWPKSVSEMRNYTEYGGQGMTGAPNTGHSEFMVSRTLHGAAPKRGEWHYHHGRQNWVWVDTH